IYVGGVDAVQAGVEQGVQLETLLQHTQGDNPADFDYAFNLNYGRRYTDRAPLFKTLRELLDARTRQCLAARRDA
ncbi:phosphohydrolase, partial [Pseudomonas aeruginosa]